MPGTRPEMFPPPLEIYLGTRPAKDLKEALLIQRERVAKMMILKIRINGVARGYGSEN